MVKLLNSEKAISWFVKELAKKGEKVYKVRNFNRDRHYAVFVNPEFNRQKRYYLVYHKDVFRTFSKKFEFYAKSNPDSSEQGESINQEWLETAIAYGKPNSSDGFQEISDVDMKLVFIYPDGTTRWVYPEFMKKYSDKHDLARVQDKYNQYKANDYYGGINTVQEITYSIPLSLLNESKPSELKNFLS